MKKQLFTILFFFVSLSSVFAQDTKNELSNYLHNFQYQKALEYIETQTATKELLQQKAFCYKALGNYYKSIEILEPLAIEYKNDIPIKVELALNYQMVSLFHQSAEVYDELIRMDSMNSYFKIQKADLLYQQSKYNEALVIYQSLISQGSSNTMLKRSAQCFDKMNLPDSAMLYYKKAWEMNDKDAFSAANYINLCLKNKHILEAQVFSDIYIERDSTDKQINLLNALAYYTLDLYEEAVARFDKCYQQGDSSLIVNRSLGIAHYSLGESEQAIKYLDKAYAQDSTNMNVLYCLAVTCNDMLQYDKATEYFNNLLSRTIPPDMTLYLYYKGLGSAYAGNEQNKDAIEAYKLALNYAGDNQKMYLYPRIANLYEFFLQDEAEACKYYQLQYASLNNYLEGLKMQEKKDSAEIATGELRVSKLDEYIRNLQTRIQENK